METEPGAVQVEPMQHVIDDPDDQAIAGAAPQARRSAGRWFSGVGSALGVSLFLAGSAALGGIAMVLWNRRLLTAIRSASAEAPEQYTLFDE